MASSNSVRVRPRSFKIPAHLSEPCAQNSLLAALLRSRSTRKEIANRQASTVLLVRLRAIRVPIFLDHLESTSAHIITPTTRRNFALAQGCSGGALVRLCLPCNSAAAARWLVYCVVVTKQTTAGNRGPRFDAARTGRTGSPDCRERLDTRSMRYFDMPRSLKCLLESVAEPSQLKKHPGVCKSKRSRLAVPVRRACPALHDPRQGNRQRVAAPVR